MESFVRLGLISVFLLIIPLPSAYAIELSGTLVYSSGTNQIFELQLQSKRQRVIYEALYNGSSAVNISHLAKVSNEEFIFDECPVMINHQRVIRESYKIPTISGK